MAKIIEVPDDLAALFSDPERLRAAWELLNALAQMSAALVPVAGSVAFGVGKPLIKGEPPNLILTLPFQFQVPIANATATAASASAQLNLLLAQLRLTGQLPS